MENETKLSILNEAFDFGKVTGMPPRRSHTKKWAEWGKNKPNNTRYAPRLYMWCLLLAALLLAWAAGDEGGGGRKASSRPIELRWSLPAWLQADDEGA